MPYQMKPPKLNLLFVQLSVRCKQGHSERLVATLQQPGLNSTCSPLKGEQIALHGTPGSQSPEGSLLGQVSPKYFSLAEDQLIAPVLIKGTQVRAPSFVASLLLVGYFKIIAWRMNYKGPFLRTSVVMNVCSGIISS